MAKKFACGDVVSGCGWSTITKDENELFQRISEHAKNVHHMTDISDEIIQKVKSKIQEI
jgi:predicted small metal-binding protein